MITVELSPAKLDRFRERAERLGVSPEKLAGYLIEFIVETSEEDFEGWMETLDILSDQKFSSDLKESVKQAQEGKVTDWNDAKRELGIA
jgi:hypothetical protein